MFEVSEGGEVHRSYIKYRMMNAEVWKVIFLETWINRLPLKEDKRWMS
jgi:hypothetical protein